MIKSLLFLFSYSVLCSLFFFTFVKTISADTYSSNCIVNPVGPNPPAVRPQCADTTTTTNGTTTTVSATNNNIVNAALTLYAAWDACKDLYTAVTCEINPLFLNSLSQSPFATGAKFMITTFPPAPTPPLPPRTGLNGDGCVQCLGFVHDVVTMATQIDATSFLGQQSPSDILQGAVPPGGPAGFTDAGPNGTLHFVKVATPQPGDIGLTDDGAGGESSGAFGHIVIVQTVHYAPDGHTLNGTFDAIESNYGDNCYITDKDSPNPWRARYPNAPPTVIHQSNYFTFYRLE